jgi:hypothetical protein
MTYKVVIPDLIRNKIFLVWIPAFAGMTDTGMTVRDYW